MEAVLEKDVEVVVDSIGEVIATGTVEVDVVDNTDLAVSVNRKEFNIVGDELYIPKRYEDAPQWLRDLIGTVTEQSYTQKITELNNLSTSLQQLIVELEVAKNTYTQSIISSNDIDERINTAITTLNSSLSSSDATIVDLISTKATPEEASAIALNTISSSINDGEIGALVGAVSSTLATETSALANNIDLVHAEMLGGFESTADVIQTTQAYVGIDEAGASTGTGLSAYLEASDGTIGGADSQLANTIRVTAEGVESKFAYNSIVNINGVYKKSGFGLSTNYTSGNGTQANPYVSEFWIDASRFKFTNSNQTGQVAPFTIDATGDTPQITFNGIVNFSNVTGTPGTGSNILTNSAPKIGSETKSWGSWTNSGMPVTLTAGWDQWRPTGGASIAAYISGSPSIGTVFDINQGSIPVIAGKRYEASAYISAHRTNSYVLVVFYSASGEVVGQATGNIINFPGSNALVNWGRSSLFVTAPSNAAVATYIVRSEVTGVSPYCFASYGFLGIAEANQTTPSSWSEGTGVGVSSSEVVNDINAGNTTTINGGKITTGSITAAQIQANSVSADRLLAGTNSTTVWTGGGLVSSNFNGNPYGAIGSPTQGFRLSSGAAGTSSDPNIYGAYIKGGIIEGSSFFYPSTAAGNFASYYYNAYKYLNFTVSGNGTTYTPAIRLVSPSYGSGLLPNRVKNLSTSVISIDTTGAISQLFAENYITTEIQISRDGGSYTKLDSMTTAEGVNKMYVGPITEYSNYIDLRLAISYGSSSSPSYSTAAALKVHLDNTAV